MTNGLISNELIQVEERLFSLVENTNEVYSSLLDFLKLPSKRIRSKLGLIYLKANNIEVSDPIISVLVAGELIHNASLIHDDIIDSSVLRRGEKTIESKFDTQTAVLCGDYLLSVAAEELLKLNNKDIQIKFFNCTKNMAQAEIMQNINKGRIPQNDVYINICKGKTACLFSTILESLAYLSGLDTNIAAELGELFGIVFQIKNDLEPTSAQNDKQNRIYTAADIFSIEKTKALIDNYFEEMSGLIQKFPENEYKKALEDLIKELCLIRKNLKQG